MAYGAVFFDRLAPLVLVSVIARDFQVPSAADGTRALLVGLGWAAAMPILRATTGRVDDRTRVVVASMLCGLAGIASAAAGSWAVFVLLRGLGGLARRKRVPCRHLPCLRRGAGTAPRTRPRHRALVHPDRGQPDLARRRDRRRGGGRLAGRDRRVGRSRRDRCGGDASGRAWHSIQPRGRDVGRVVLAAGRSAAQHRNLHHRLCRLLAWLTVWSQSSVPLLRSWLGASRRRHRPTGPGPPHARPTVPGHPRVVKRAISKHAAHSASGRTQAASYKATINQDSRDRRPLTIGPGARLNGSEANRPHDPASSVAIANLVGRQSGSRSRSPCTYSGSARRSRNAPTNLAPKCARRTSDDER